MDDPTIHEPSRRYFVEGVRQSDGSFLARYGIPGRNPQLVTDKPGVPAVYDSEAEAVADAAEALCEALNLRVKGSKNFKTRLMGGDELALQLNALGITPYDLARIVCTDPKRVKAWLDEGEVPHMARLLLDMWSLDRAAMERSERVTRSVEYRRQPQKKEAP